MNKTFRLMSLALGMMACCAGFVACGDDDDPLTITPTPVTDQLAGTWKYILNDDVPNGDGTRNITYTETLTFADGGAFSNETNHDGSSWDQSRSRTEGTWSKLGSDKIVVNLSNRSNYNYDSQTFEADQNFQPRKDTLDYFFKGSALFCESVENYGTFAYTRTGNLPYRGFGDYNGLPVLGTWVGEDFAWDGTPIELRYELKADGTVAVTMDNHLGWSEGMAGYYLVKDNQIMFISYYFISKMDSDTADWEVEGFMLQGGEWNNFQIQDNLFYVYSIWSGEMGCLVKEGTDLGRTLVGHWKSTEQIWAGGDNPIDEDEYWEIESDGTVRHWWIRDNVFAEGTMGTYQLKEDSNETYIDCHWTHWLADSGDNTNPKQGNETGRGGQDYTVKYIYSKITDRLLVRWSDSDYTFEQFKRIQ